MLAVVNLLSHSDLLSRRTVCGRHFLGNCRHLSPQIEGFGGRSKNQARKRHVNISFFVRLVLGRPRVCPGISPCLSLGQIRWTTWDKPGFSPYFTQWMPDFTGFVPGTNPVCPWDSPGDEGRHRKLGHRSCRTKVPEFFEFSSRILPRILLRIFPEFFEDFSCFVSWETETRKNSPKIPAIFQCKIPRQTRKKYSQNSSGEQAE